jgi:mannobiose 2-epimerase
MGMNRNILRGFRKELNDELVSNILPYWSRFRDIKRGGYFGEISNEGIIDDNAPKGLVMHARFLWTYSAAYRFNGDAASSAEAERCYGFLRDVLRDRENGGFFWMIDADGQPVERKKIIYGEAFAVYALSEYFLATGSEEALKSAVATFAILERSSRDRENGGYFEACLPDWSASVDSTLGEKDLSCAKSMNTNLHVLEAYSSLFAASGRSDVGEALRELLDVMLSRVIVEPGHFGLYFSRDWKSLVEHRSFGHDIEGSWLIAEAAGRIGGLSVETKSAVLEMARAAAEIAAGRGPGLINEESGGSFDTDRIWWVQAEAMTGFLNAFELSGDERFLELSVEIWAYIKAHIIDARYGEWIWGTHEDGTPIGRRPKGGFWKANYHDARACMESCARLDRIIGEGRSRPE